MAENFPSFEIVQNHDPKGNEFFTFSATNKNLGLRMEIEPALIVGMEEPPEEPTGKYQKDIMEVYFFNTDNNKMAFPIEGYEIRSSEIPELDASNKDTLEEILARYAGSFSKITYYKDFKDLVGQIFPDIEQKRKPE